MSNSKHYVLSFTTPFCNKKGYVLMFNRHQNVHHVDNFPLSFEPWNRYSALIMRDMKMGTKVKRATGVLHSALANFKTIFEGNNPDELKKGSLFYLSNLSENLTRSKLNPTYGVVNKHEKINNFYNYFGDIIHKVNNQVVKSINLPSDLVKIKIIENGREILRMLHLDGEGSAPKLLHQQGYNQAIELADLLFKDGELGTADKFSTVDRLLTIQYGEKAVDMVKTSFVKVVLDSLTDLLVNGKKIEVVTLDGLPSDFEAFRVVGYGFLDEFQKPNANAESQEIIEIVDSMKFTDVFNSSLDSLDDAVNVKKNIESVTTTTTNVVVTYADCISTDVSEKLMTEINPKIYEGLLSSVVFSDEVSYYHEVFLEDGETVTVKVEVDGQQSGYDEGDVSYDGDILMLMDSSHFYYANGEQGYEEGGSFNETKHSSNEDTRAISLKFSMGGVKSVDEIETTTDKRFFFGVVLETANSDSGAVRHAVLDLADGAEYRSVYLIDTVEGGDFNYSNHYHADLVGVSVSDKFVIGDNSPELSDGDLIYRLSDISVGESATVTVGGEGELYRLDTLSTEDEKEVELHWGTYGFKGESEHDVVIEVVDIVNKVDDTLDLIVDGEDMAIRITDVLDIHLDRKSVSAMKKEEILNVSTESMDNGIKLEVTFDTLLSNAVRVVRQETTMDTDVSDIEAFDILDPVIDVHVGDHELAHKNEVVLNTVVEDIELAAREGETFNVSLHLTEKSLRQDYDLDVAVDLQESANLIDRMFNVSVEVTEYGDKNEGALDVYVELHEVAEKDGVADTVVDKGIMVAGAERTPDVAVHSFDVSEQSDEDRDVDVFIPTTAELEKEDNVILEFSGTAETTRTDDILLEGQDVAYGDNSRDVVLESTYTADSGRTSDVVVELPDMATGGNSYDVVITLSENGVTNASSDVVVEDVQKAIANAGVDVNIEGISLASADDTRDVTVELPDFAITSDTVHDVAIETQDLAETNITTDVVVGVAELVELHKTDDVAIDGTDFGTSEKDVDVVVEGTVTAESDSHVDVSIEYGDMADNYEDVDVTIETPVLAGQDSTTDTVIEDIDLADSNSSADVVIDSEVLAESGNEHDTVIEGFDFADFSQEVDAVVETPEMADSSETADTVIEEPEMATSENTADVVVDDTELAEPSNTFHDVIVEDFTPSTRGRKRLLDLMEEEEFEPVGDRLIEIYEEEEVTSGGSTIMILEEEELAEPTTTSYISIEDDELADRTNSSLLEIDEDEETRPASTKGIVIEDDEQVTKYKSLNDITIEGEDEGHREREFGVAIDFEDEGAKPGREFPIDIDDDDPGIGLPPTDPPWEEPQPKGKIWLIMGKPFPAWNGWNNKKTR